MEITTQIIYGAFIGCGAVSIILSICRTINTYNLNIKVDRLLRLIQEQILSETVPEPQQMPIKPQYQQQPYQVPPQQQYAQMQPQPVVPNIPKPTKQDFAARVREMNEAKKRKRLERQMAELQSQMPPQQ